MSIAVGSGHVVDQVLAPFILLKSCMALLSNMRVLGPRVLGAMVLGPFSLLLLVLSSLPLLPQLLLSWPSSSLLLDVLCELLLQALLSSLLALLSSLLLSSTASSSSLSLLSSLSSLLLLLLSWLLLLCDPLWLGCLFSSAKVRWRWEVGGSRWLNAHGWCNWYATWFCIGVWMRKKGIRGVDTPCELAWGPCCISCSVFLCTVGGSFPKQCEWAGHGGWGNLPRAFHTLFLPLGCSFSLTCHLQIIVVAFCDLVWHCFQFFVWFVSGRLGWLAFLGCWGLSLNPTVVAWLCRSCIGCSDVPAQAWPESPSFGLAWRGFGSLGIQAKPKAVKVGLALA